MMRYYIVSAYYDPRHPGFSMIKEETFDFNGHKVTINYVEPDGDLFWHKLQKETYDVETTFYQERKTRCKNISFRDNVKPMYFCCLYDGKFIYDEELKDKRKEVQCFLENKLKDFPKIKLSFEK